MSCHSSAKKQSRLITPQLSRPTGVWAAQVTSDRLVQSYLRLLMLVRDRFNLLAHREFMLRPCLRGPEWWAVTDAGATAP